MYTFRGGWAERRQSVFDRFPRPDGWVALFGDEGCGSPKHPFCGSLLSENCHHQTPSVVDHLAWARSAVVH